MAAGPAMRRGKPHSLGNSARAVARGHVVPFTGTRGGTVSSMSGCSQRMATGAADRAVGQAGNGGRGDSDAQTHQSTADTRERESRPGARDNATGASNASQTGRAANMREHGGNGSTPKKPNAPSALTFAHCSEAPGTMAAHGCSGHCGRGEAIAAGAQPSATNTRERGEGLNAPSGDKLRTPAATTTGGAAKTRERGGEAATRSC